MKKKIINGLLFAVALVAATSSFVSCKDYEGDNYAEFQEKFSTLEEAYKAQVLAMSEYVKSLDNYVLTSRYNAETGYSPAELLAKGTIKERLDILEAFDPASIEEDLAERLADLINQNNLAIKKAQALAEKDSAMLHKLVIAWGPDLDYAVGKAAEVLATVAKDSTKWNQAYETLQAKEAKWDEAYEAYKALIEGSEEWGEASELAIAANKFIFSDNYKGEFKNLQELIDAFKEADIALADRIKALEEASSAVIEAYKAKVDGVIVQEVRNPIFGTYAYPVGFETNILAAYYGETANPVWFPAGDGEDLDYWVGSTSDIQTAELEAIGYEPKQFSGILFDEYQGNAGRIAMTVNTNAENLDGKTFALATFTGNVSKVALSPLEPATEDLYFGHRAAAPNGAYVTYATIKKDNVKDVNFSFNFEGSGMKSQITELLKDWSSASTSDVIKLGLGVFNILDNAKTLKLGMQTSYQDPVVGWTSSYYDANIAAMSLRPVGFDFLYDQNFSGPIIKLRDKLTAKERSIAQELLNDIVDVIKVEIGLPSGNTNIEVDGDQIYMVIPAGSISATASYTIPANTFGAHAAYTLTPIEVSAPTGEAYKMNITPLYNAIKEGIETSIGKIDDKAGETAGKYLNKLINVQNRFLNKIAGVAANPNRYIQPALLASNDALGYFYPSREYWTPTLVKSGTTIKFYPTTLCGEVIAPAYRKYVAILNGQKNVAPFNTILSGSEYNINKPMELTVNAAPGTLLEIVYECLGYNGKVAGKRYYIEVF